MALAEQGLSGVTLLMLEVDPCGAVAQVRVERSSGYAEFDQAAVEAAQGWRLAPAYQDGVAVPQRVRRPVRFELIEDLP
ncbi:energy transducer TonB [Lysobacter sp. 5GHs7-4]|uniref:energy transducer TonB n=1 Tax=Lysobacter sp. 5GHs7-4 TaxID=2904253 RepID=UPI001E337292|nr:energy transducer TonB [Lysobacter sp. 5GHs7-4]UHQ24439.1 energy transducer TonB [Lysobacter sp. 5GHs7-4]